MNTDIVVIGGGAAGLTAGLVLARDRHRVTLIDDRTYRHATVDEFHGFPTRDATAPDRFRADAVRELSRYGVAFVGSTVTRVKSTDRIVRVELDDGTAIAASAMLLATGVQDELPVIDGLGQRWGKSVFNCPFRDGWEQRDQPVIVIDAAPGADHLAGMVPWARINRSKQTRSDGSPRGHTAAPAVRPKWRAEKGRTGRKKGGKHRSTTVTHGQQRSLGNQP